MNIHRYKNRYNDRLGCLIVVVSWNTAEKHLLELTLDNKITRMKKAGVNLWVIK